MRLDINKDQVLSVKIYFINPISLLSVITDTLIKLEFETYSVDKGDKDKLVSILDNNIRNVLFICILNEIEMEYWIDFIDKAFKIKETFIQIGAFVYNTISIDDKLSLLERGIPVIPISEIRMNTIDVMKRILFYFEAKGKRKYIRARAFGKTEVFFDMEDTHKTVKGTIIDISAYAFSCQIMTMYAPFFTVGDICDNVLLVLKGSRVRTSVKLIGISKLNPEIYVFKYQRENVIDKKTVHQEGLSSTDKNKIHHYIQLCLKVDLKRQLNDAENS